MNEGCFVCEETRRFRIHVQHRGAAQPTMATRAKRSWTPPHNPEPLDSEHTCALPSPLPRLRP
jgi:hypothetical protein